ncbi:helix-turn-helix domain-containing protein [Cohnella cellulosilytica]|uniref:Helix-turn-helix domain-containing protein n=1 Tax=Cohnella cellulosilytica TaxID=986710 RepID=A0ABW2FL30_9BACL
MDLNGTSSDRLYTFESIESGILNGGTEGDVFVHELPGFLVIAEGEGLLEADTGVVYRVQKGSVFLRKPGSAARLSASPGSGGVLHVRHVVFRPIPLFPTASGRAASEAAGEWNAAGAFVESAGSLLDWAGELAHFGTDEERGLRLERHILVQKMVLWWIRNVRLANPGFASIAVAADYVHRHFRLPLDMERLASLAGFSVSHFALLFKRYTGCSPSEYLNTLRINRAKELLIAGELELKRIAPEAACKDEWYFSRKFKKKTGLSPTRYRKQAREHVVSYSFPISNHLVALNVRPSAAFVHPADRPRHREGTVCLRYGDTESEQLAALKRMQPDLSLFLDEMTPEERTFREKARAWTPTLTIPWMSMDWQEQMLAISEWVNRKEAALGWIADFETSAREARRRVRASVGEEETVGVLVVSGGQCSVYGVRNIGYSLYRSLKLSPPPALRRLFESDRNFYAVEVPIERLADYAADRMLVMVRRDVPGTEDFFRRLRRTPSWRALEADPRRRFYYIEPDKWLMYDPLSVREQLGLAKELLISGMSK